MSTKLGHAVVRNRVRRRLREIYRLNAPALKAGYDIIIVARTRCVGAEYAKMDRAFLSVRKARPDEGDGGMKKLHACRHPLLQEEDIPEPSPCCRFIPTCSQYAMEAIEKYGALKGRRARAPAYLLLPSVLSRAARHL